MLYWQWVTTKAWTYDLEFDLNQIVEHESIFWISLILRNPKLSPKIDPPKLGNKFLWIKCAQEFPLLLPMLEWYQFYSCSNSKVYHRVSNESTRMGYAWWDGMIWSLILLSIPCHMQVSNDLSGIKCWFWVFRDPMILLNRQVWVVGFKPMLLSVLVHTLPKLFVNQWIHSPKIRCIL